MKSPHEKALGKAKNKIKFSGQLSESEKKEAHQAFKKSPKLRSFGFGGGKSRGEATRY